MKSTDTLLLGNSMPRAEPEPLTSQSIWDFLMGMTKVTD